MAVGVRAAVPGLLIAAAARPVSLRYPMPPAHGWPCPRTTPSSPGSPPNRSASATHLRLSATGRATIINATASMRAGNRQPHRPDGRAARSGRLGDACSPVPTRYVPAEALLAADP